MASSISIESEYFLNRSIQQIDGTLTCICTQGQNEPGNTEKEGTPYICRG